MTSVPNSTSTGMGFDSRPDFRVGPSVGAAWRPSRYPRPRKAGSPPSDSLWDLGSTPLVAITPGGYDCCSYFFAFSLIRFYFYSFVAIGGKCKLTFSDQDQFGLIDHNTLDLYTKSVHLHTFYIFISIQNCCCIHHKSPKIVTFCSFANSVPLNSFVT